MAHYKRFGATNAPGTCLWCGARLGWTITRAFAAEHYGGRRGENGDELFCRTMCGYQFAVVLAQGGRRLQPAAQD